jgi:2',3'-cyclic-nucleotide 2'-phosphodiesterase (5'-nucleotidase family)
VPGKPFRVIISNMEGAAKLLPETREFAIFSMGGVKVGVVGIISPATYGNQQPKNWGPLKIQEPVAAAMAVQKKARDAGADFVVCLVHMGLSSTKMPAAGELIDFARNVSGFAIIFGDHTGVQWSDMNINGQVVLETKNNGGSYSRARITWDKINKRIVEKEVQFVVPIITGVVPDAKMLLMLDGFRAKLAPIYSRIIGYSPMFFIRKGNCSPLPAGTKCEAIQGNLIIDALRFAYPKIQFGITNAGGVRSGFVPRQSDQDRALCYYHGHRAWRAPV